ncbi:hypothetical protein BLNAU_10130 [Blattamonas nauphoetae]|uniref:Uncharacterized protein n=1 Tax=Blattamonas nauphoetae TaxID=2049346 RepID=A0ABQ9XU35_9EUKA|nr:hypothetical protein BLNAU_10130 [Blattamonas nauphoetae]
MDDHSRNGVIATEKTVRFCDSTSGAPNVYVAGGADDMSDLVPQLESTPTVTVSVSFSGERAAVTATASEGVKGTMGILLNGSNVPRLVHVPFGTDSETSTSGTAVVYSGDRGLLPKAEYSLRASSMPSNYLSLLRVNSAHSSLKDGNTTTIVLHGMNLKEGNYWMLIPNGGNHFNISLTRSDTTTLVGEAPLHPLDASGRLEWGTQYEVKKVMWLPQGGVEADVHTLNRITFTTPAEPPRIKSLSSRSLNGKKDELTVSFLASLLPDGTGTIHVKQTGSDTLVEGVLTRNSPTQCTAMLSTAWGEDTNHLSFGKTYSVQSATIDSVDVVIDSGISFTVPNPPVITSFSVPTECSSDSFKIDVIGQNLPSPHTYTLTLSDSHNVLITFSESTKGRGTVKAGLPTEVQFNTMYTVQSVTKEGPTISHQAFHLYLIKF